MVAGWQPATGLERTLFEAIQQGNQAEYLRLLAEAALLVPVQQDANGQTTGWVTSTSGGRTYLLGYTSATALAGVAGDRQVPYLTTSAPELARRWPDPEWWLAINSGLPIEALISPEYLAQLRSTVPAPDAAPVTADSSATTKLPDAAAGPQAAAVSPAGAESRGEAAGTGVSDADEDLTDEDLADELPDLADPDRFQPGNETETAMLDAVEQGDTDAYLKALIVAELLVPESGGGADAWPRIRISGQPAIPLFTSMTRYAERYGDAPYRLVEAITAIRDWPASDVALALNPGTPVGAHLPGLQVAELSGWAAEIGLLDILEDAGEEGGSEVETPLHATPTAPPEPVGWLQKLLPHEHVDFYQQRGYHLVSGFVHPLRAVGEGIQPARLYQLLGLDGPDSVFSPEDPQVHVVRWPGYGDGRYGDPDRTPGSGVVPQYRVAGVPLPHGALLIRIDRAGEESVVASFDADSRQWRTAGSGEAGAS